jgi:hypothetical protein
MLVKSELAEYMGSKKFSKNKQNKNPSEMRLAKLKKEVEFAQLQVIALNTLIDIAEENFNIAIREKPSAGKSTK